MLNNKIKGLLSRTPLSDKIVFAYLCLLVAALAIKYQSVPELKQWFLFHTVLLAGYLIVNIIYSYFTSLAVVQYLRVVTAIGTILTLYYTLGQTAPMAFDWHADAFFARIDRLLFTGTSPSLWVERFSRYGTVEFFSFIYGLFIPYLYLSIIIGCIGRPESERQMFLNGLAFTYCISFIGYLFTPAYGPVIYYQDQFVAPLSGGHFHRIVLNSIASLGGPHGAFPSLHVGASSFVCLFDLKYSRLRGLTYLPVVTLIIVATVFLRYHYVIDTAAGVLIAFIAFKVVTITEKEEKCSTASFAYLRAWD